MKMGKIDVIKKRVTLVNVIATLLAQLMTIASGFVVPKIILSYFGSEVNGLVSSLLQFLSYVSLVEGGVTGVITASLYGPLVEKNYEKVGQIISSARKFYRNIGLVFIAYAFLLALTYPLIFETDFSYLYIMSLVIVLAINLTVQYMFSLTYRTLLIADKKLYVTSLTQALIRALEIVSAVISVKVFPNIHVLKLLTGLVFLIQPIVYHAFIKKHYTLNLENKYDSILIKNRWNGFAINTAAFIHNSTDIVVLTIFTNFITVSIYSVYVLVTNGIKSILKSVFSSLEPAIGHAYARKNYKDLNKKLDLYEYVAFILVFFVFGVAALLITPFVQIYVGGVTDADYYQPLFGYLLVVSEALYLIKFPHLSLAYSANKFKEISLPAFIEAGINIVLSLALVPFLGILGVAIGTTAAMAYRLVFHVYYTSIIIPNRPQRLFYKKAAMFVIMYAACFLACSMIRMTEVTVYNFIVYALLYCMIVGMGLIVISMAFFRNEISDLMEYIKKK